MTLLRRAFEVFERVCELEGAARTERIAEECAGDESLRAEVEALCAGDDTGLAAIDDETHSPFGRELVESALRSGSAPSAPSAPGPLPERIGPYRIVALLGEGGMGLVYEARQETPRRRVALKVAHPTKVTGEKARRLEREAQILAQLKHPSIAQVYDSGTFESGVGARPFFAMEFVEGRTLLAHAESQELDERARLELVLEVADALQHAHERGIIHRDIKPDNVLVDGEGRAKVLDFGIARAFETTTELATLVTRDGQMMGTLAYMPPEQLAGDAGRITPVADVYALGALCYELLAGTPPHDLDGLPTPVATRVLMENDAPSLRSRLRGVASDLDTVVGKALEKDPDRRYASAAAFAADVRAYLAGRPILARPPSSAYRARKYVGRHPAAAVALLIFVAGLVSTRFFARRAGENETRATSAVARLASLELSLEEKVAELESFSDIVLVRDLEERAKGLWPRRPELQGAMGDWLDEARALHARLPEHRRSLARVEEQVALAQVIADEARALPVAAGEGAEPDGPSFDAERRWRHETLVALVAALEDLEATIEDVQARERFAVDVARRTLDEAGEAWERTLAEVRESPLYGDPTGAGLMLEPQVGLVPLGADPESGLQEFWHWESGERPARDPTTGRLVAHGEMGLVLVLLPAGTLWIGAQGEDATGPNYDPDADRDESPVARVELDAFFISKYEMTQAQWAALGAPNPSRFTVDEVVGAAARMHPVESVVRDAAEQVLLRAGLVLPTEAQWEYAARGGTTTPWWTGSEPRSAEGAGNFADRRFKESFTDIGGHEAWLDDGFDLHAPVGAFAANPYGLHGVMGNVWEWCRDDYAAYAVPMRPGDGLRVPEPERGSATGVLRGGSFMSGVEDARSAQRARNPLSNGGYNRGVRPALALDVDTGASTAGAGAGR